jgi:LPXTG-site transpeptidase (sortase) family protein
LVVAISVVLAAAGGLLVARNAPDESVASAEPQARVVSVASEEPDLDPIAGVASGLVQALQADLPVPGPSPLDPHEPTSEVRHGLLEIPSIGLSQPFFEGVTLTAINRGPSHWPGTAMPGELGNVVLAGHRTTYTRPFWDLDLVRPGDELIFTMTDGTRHVYVADGIEVVDDEAIHIVDQTYGYRATLFGCHPKFSARQRIVGHFTLASTTPPPTPSS